MPERILAIRVGNLERKVELLESLPARVGAMELQIVQLRTEMREQFSVIRQEFGEAVREGDEETRRYMRILHEEVLSRIAMIQESLPAASGNRPKTTRRNRRIQLAMTGTPMLNQQLTASPRLFAGENVH